MESKFSQYEKVMKSFGKFFNHEFLETILASKADLDTIHQINRERASVDQLNEVKNQMETLNDRLKHLSVISGEIVKNIGPKFKDDEGMRHLKLQKDFKLVNTLIQNKELSGDNKHLFFRPACKIKKNLSPKSSKKQQDINSPFENKRNSTKIILKPPAPFQNSQNQSMIDDDATVNKDQLDMSLRKSRGMIISPTNFSEALRNNAEKNMFTHEMSPET